MKDLRRNFERFCYRNSTKGIPNLMLYIAIGNLIVYLFSMMDPSNVLYSALCFNRTAILHGQIWRLFTYVFTYLLDSSAWNLFLSAICLFFYYQIGKMLEASWGALRFNLFYLSGIVIMDIAALLLHCNASINYLNLSLFLAFATACPETRVLFMFIIPIKMKYLAWVYLAISLLEVLGTPFPTNLFPIFAMLNYFLFFGSEVRNVLPGSGNFSTNRVHSQRPKPNPNWANKYQSKTGEKPYMHKCTVCGRTDTQYPDLEFRYCSKCNGYYCYCMDHINNHAHIQ